MYKEALLKNSNPEEPTMEPEMGSNTPAGTPHQGAPATRLPSVEYFANFRGPHSHETYSVTSTENTARSKGLTPSESWADDDDEFMESVVQALRGDSSNRSQAKKAPRKAESGWKQVAKPQREAPARRGNHNQHFNAPAASIGNWRSEGSGNAPAQLSGGRFDALSRR